VKRRTHVSNLVTCAHREPHRELAWALAGAADRCVEPGERFYIYVALGAGDTDTAIAGLRRAVAREQRELPPMSYRRSRRGTAPKMGGILVP
jgi:hypothetical protein